MPCEEHFADALLGETEGCHACATLLRRSLDVGAELSCLPRHAPPPRIWRHLSGVLEDGRRQRMAAVWTSVFSGLAAAVLLGVLLRPLISSVPETPRIAAEAPQAQLDPVPELREMRSAQEGGLTLLAGADY